MTAVAPNFWHLYVFRAVIDAGLLTRASVRLGLTQPAASQAIKNLERHFSAPLFVRGKSAMVLTEAGSILSARADCALALLFEGLSDVLGGGGASGNQLRAISPRRLETLVSIVRNGSFTEAARADGLAAPTVHRAARDLEQALGVPLFETTSHGVRPTRQAEILARKAGLALAEVRQARAEIAESCGREVGRTVIGAMPLARAHLVPVAVAAFNTKYAEHRIAIVEGAYEDLLTGLRRGEIDLLVGALRSAPKADIDESLLFDDPLAIVMRAGHPAAAKKNLSVNDLTAYPWIVPRVTSPLREHFAALFRDFNMPPPEDVIECNSLGASRVLLLNSDRLMLLSDEQIRYEKAAGMLVSKRHPGGRVARPIGLTKRRNWKPTQAQQALVSEIIVQAQKIKAC